jgi:hypothetical protein
MTDLFSYAEQQARLGMARAVAAADRRIPLWSEEAFAFLRNFASTHPSFISEDVSDAHEGAGFPQPGNLRAWGAIYRRAVKAGLIRQDGIGRSRRRHNSICPKWKSLIYQ